MGCLTPGHCLERREGAPSCEHQAGGRGAHVGGGGIPSEDGPGLPAHVVAVLLVHVFSQPVHGSVAGQPERQLQVLMGKLQGPDACVQPEPQGKDESHQPAVSAKKLSAPLPIDFKTSCFVYTLVHFHTTFGGLSRVSLILYF